MNEVEMAIDAIETAFEQEPFLEQGYEFYVVRKESLTTAIAALREQAERNKGCEYCNTGESLNGYEDVGSFIILPKGKKYYLEITFNRDFYNCTTDINYCPMCGKRLEVKHEAD